MSIYADATVKIKPRDIKKYKGLKGKGQFEGVNGFDLIYKKLGIKRLFIGHNPFDKLAEQGVGAVELGLTIRSLPRRI